MEKYLVYIAFYMVITLPVMLLFLAAAAKIGFIESFIRLNDLASDEESE